jgi:hypothetical protein
LTGKQLKIKKEKCKRGGGTMKDVKLRMKNFMKRGVSSFQISVFRGKKPGCATEAQRRRGSRYIKVGRMIAGVNHGTGQRNFKVQRSRGFTETAGFRDCCGQECPRSVFGGFRRDFGGIWRIFGGCKWLISRLFPIIPG